MHYTFQRELNGTVIHLLWQVKVIFEFLRNGFQDIRSSLDLFFEDDTVADEKIPFLAYLANVLKADSFFPYEPPAGSRRFRNLISGFMKTYHHVPLTANVRKCSPFTMLYILVRKNSIS